MEILKSGIVSNLTMYKKILIVFLALALLMPSAAVSAQESTPSTGPVYIIQPGDSLWSIAIKFGVSLNDLMAANNISDSNNISTGAQLVIPGLPGITGILSTETLGYGDTLKSRSRNMRIPTSLLRRLNHITNPGELYAGYSLVYLTGNASQTTTSKFTLSNGKTLLEAAVENNTDIWSLAELNELNGSWDAVPGDILYTPSSGSAQPPNGMPDIFASIDVKPLPITQGGTADIIVETQPDVQLSGLLVDKPLHFFPLDTNKYVALAGTYALLDPGPYPLELDATLPDGTKQSFTQLVIIKSGNYPTDPLLSVSTDTIDPTTNDTENQKLIELTAPITPTRYWQGGFTNPSPDFSDCHPSYFGDRRNYLGKGTNETFHSFHSGLDFCGRVGTPIVAAANGVVIFTDMLTVHGNTTIIDHGWGIYSMYSHQSRIDVQVGQQVKAGDPIGLVGETGRVTGPHLHWEVWVSGVQVNPMDWLQNIYP
jgi:murein DD-endopeptidase MepM/ murein hydrolase activator NlpD